MSILIFDARGANEENSEIRRVTSEVNYPWNIGDHGRDEGASPQRISFFFFWDITLDQTSLGLIG